LRATRPGTSRKAASEKVASIRRMWPMRTLMRCRTACGLSSRNAINACRSRTTHRLGIHGAHRLILEDGQLAEAVPGKEHREDRFRAAAPHSRDLHLPANDDVK